MIKKRILKTLVLMATLLCVAAVPAMAEPETNGPIVFLEQWDFSWTFGSLSSYDPQSNQLTQSNTGGEHLDVTPNGRTVVLSANDSELYSVPIYGFGSAAPTRLTNNGNDDPNAAERFRARYPTVSPDGKTVYFSYEVYNSGFTRFISADIYAVPIGGGEITRVTHDSRLRNNLEVTPDGKNFVYNDGNVNLTRLFVESLSGGAPTPLLNENAGINIAYEPTVSPDGTTVAFIGRFEEDGSWKAALFTVPLSAGGGGTPTQVAGTEIYTDDGHTILGPDFSPDGESIAYTVAQYDSGGSGFRWAELKSVPPEGGTVTTFFRDEPVNSTTIVPGQKVWAPTPEAATQVTSTDPENGAVRVARTIKPKAAFTNDLDQSTVNNLNVKFQASSATKKKWVAVRATPSYHSGSKTITITPANNLGSHRKYRVTLTTGLTSTRGTALEQPYTWGFTTR